MEGEGLTLDFGMEADSSSFFNADKPGMSLGARTYCSHTPCLETGLASHQRACGVH